jgi:sarcosine oxidase
VCEHHHGAHARAEQLDRAFHPADEVRVRAFVRAHLPAADGPLRDARVCMYTNTPDDHFVIGPHPEHAQVIVACGFSGHGFKLAPAVGAMIADHLENGAGLPPLFDPLRLRG